MQLQYGFKVTPLAPTESAQKTKDNMNIRILETVVESPRVLENVGSLCLRGLFYVVFRAPSKPYRSRLALLFTI